MCIEHERESNSDAPKDEGDEIVEQPEDIQPQESDDEESSDSDELPPSKGKGKGYTKDSPQCVARIDHGKGRRCRLHAQQGKTLCWPHRNYRVEAATEAAEQAAEPAARDLADEEIADTGTAIPIQKSNKYAYPSLPFLESPLIA